MAKKIVCGILLGIVIIALLWLIFPKPANAVKNWVVGIFSSEKQDDTNDNKDDSNKNPSNDKEENSDISVNVTIDEMTAAERLELILKNREQILEKLDKAKEFTLYDAMILSMHIKLDKDGKYLENGHNMPATGTTTYPMSEYPGGWTWVNDETKAEDGNILVPMFICGDKIAIYQPNLGNKEFKAADVNNLEIMLCIHEDGLLSLSWERNLGEVAIVKFDEAGKTAFQNAFRWWWEVSDNGEKVAVIGFTYCNYAPEGVDIVPVLVGRVEKTDEK